MNMTGHERLFKNVLIIACAINILLNLILIPYLGINGAAIAGMVSLSFWNVFTLIYIKLKYGQSIGYFPWICHTHKVHS
jgi:O-antigen/teichoic acid export membrane protein